MEFSKEIISKRIKNTRIERGLNAIEVANAVGISKSSMSLIESGRNAPDLRTLFSISNYLDVSTDYLLGLSETPTRQP